MSFATVLGYALLPLLGNFAGGLLAERVRLDQRRLGLALHLAAGVVVGVVAIELMPQALASRRPWWVFVGLGLGGLFVLGADHLTHFVSARAGAGAPAGAPMMMATAFDLFSDGVMIGAGTTVDPSLGLLLAVGQVPADLPEGFATNATFRQQGVPRRRRILLIAALGMPILLGAAIGYGVLQGRPLHWKLAVLAFTAGALLTLLVEEIVPQGHQEDEGRLAALLFIGGLLLFFALSIVLD